MQEVRAEFDIQPRPHRLRSACDLDGEVFRLDQVGIAATAVSLGLDLCAQPFRAMDRPRLLGELGGLLRLTQLGVDLAADSALRGEVAGIQPGEECDGLRCLRLGCRFSFCTPTTRFALACQAAKVSICSHGTSFLAAYDTPHEFRTKRSRATWLCAWRAWLLFVT